MGIKTSSWEPYLLARAHEAFENRLPHEVILADLKSRIQPDVMEKAYMHCEQITRQRSKTFFLASGLLPREKRKAARALYAFCRVSDDLVDRTAGETALQPAEALRSWQQAALGEKTNHENPVLLAWIDARSRFKIPLRYAEQLIEGVAADLKATRYETFEALAAYCYGVASTVGLMSMHIIGFSGTEAIPYAVKLGVALQLTNILRDVGEDWCKGRMYLPLDELAEFHLDERAIPRNKVTERWRDFMRFQIERNRELYAESLPGIRFLHPDGRFAIAAAALLYQDILKDIEVHDYDVFTRRAYLTGLEKLSKLPGIWRQVKKGEFS
jgi:phytoene synthase